MSHYTPNREQQKFKQWHKEHLSLKAVSNDAQYNIPLSRRIAKAGKHTRQHNNLLHWKKTLQYNPSLL